MRLHTFADGSMLLLNDKTFGECFQGSHLSSQMLIDFPSPILQLAPHWITSLPRRMLFQAYDAELGLDASMTKLFGKNFALKTQ